MFTFSQSFKMCVSEAMRQDVLRCFSGEVKTRQDNKNIRIYTVESDTVRPLVLMFSWMLAKRKHLQKYTDLYINEGFDVQTFQVGASSHKCQLFTNQMERVPLVSICTII